MEKRSGIKNGGTNDANNKRSCKRCGCTHTHTHTRIILNITKIMILEAILYCPVYLLTQGDRVLPF